MKENIKNNEFQERQKYVPASIEAINVTAQEVLCQSTLNSLEQYEIEYW